MSGPAPGAQRRILIRLPNWLGDVMMARPLLHAVRAAHPHAEIRAVGKAPLLALIESDRTSDTAEAWPSDGGGRRDLEARLRAWRPDAALVMPFSFSSARFAWAIRACMRIGYAHELRSPLLTHALRRPARGERHLSDEYLALGAPIGVASAAASVALPRLAPTAGAETAAVALIARLLPGATRFVVMAPRSAYGPAREWPAERFAAIARRLVARGAGVIVCGTASERETCARVAEEAGAGVVSAAGETDLPVLAALVARAALALCNDSGLAHLAGAVGTATLTLYGSTSSAWTAALGPRVRVVQHPPVCAPCFRRTCRIGYLCLTRIGLDEVDFACREAGA